MLRLINVMWSDSKYVRLISAGLCAFGGIFLAVCLWTFSVNDQSLVYFSTHPLIIENKLGMCGAHIAGFFYYLFGSVSFLFAPLLFFASHLSSIFQHSRCTFYYFFYF